MVRRPDGEDPTTAQFGGIIESTTPANASEYDVVLLGEPYDGATTGRPGAREGPAAIRAALASVDTHHLDAGPVDSVGDLGTVEIPFGGSVSTAQEAVRETVSDLHAAETLPILLGGDGSLTYANVVGLLDVTAATDGGYITDGGFGEDEESVGDVEHFDPTVEDEDDGEDEVDTDEEDDSAESSESSEADAAESTDEDDESGETDADDVEDDASEGDSLDDDGDTDATDSDGEATAADSDDGDADEDGDDSNDEASDDSDADDSDDSNDEASDDSDDEEEQQTETTDSDDEEGPTETDEEDDADETADSVETTGQSETIADDGAEQTGFGTDSGDTDTEVIDETESGDGTGGSTDDATATSSVGVISLAARLDCKQAGEPTARSRHRDLLEAGVDSLAVLGARHFESTTAEAEYLRDNDGTVVTAEEVAEDPVEATDHALDAMADVEQLYVSIDLSVLDPAAAPGVSDPAPGGLNTRELFRVVRLLASDDRIAGIELIEAVPSLDEGGRTVDAAARAVAHAVSTVE